MNSVYRLLVFLLVLSRSSFGVFGGANEHDLPVQAGDNAHFHARFKDACYEEIHPYIKTREVVLNKVTTASGQPLRLCDNPLMFKEVVVTHQKKADHEGDQNIQLYEVDESLVVRTASPEAYARWREDRFGLFVHWAPISQLGEEVGHSRYSASHRTGGEPYKKGAISPEVYDVQYKTFNPTNFNPDAIARIAKAAGARYVVFTAKHHDGFSMFATAQSEYSIMHTPYGRDITRMFADAFRAQGLEFGFYYSPRDWYHPDCDSDHHHDRYIDFYKAQIAELLSNYGPIHEIWFDGLGPGDWGNTSQEVMAMIRAAHPDAMVNDRGGAGADFYTPEHHVSYFNRAAAWEACHTTTTRRWGFNPKMTAKSLELLLEIALYTWGADGNLLLNIGPTGEGEFNPVELERWTQLGSWWTLHGDSIRGSRGGPYMPGPWGVATCKDHRVFLHVFQGLEQGALWFPALEGLTLKGARLMNGTAVDVRNKSDGFTVDVPASLRDPIVTTIELSFDGDTVAAPPLHRVEPLLPKAALTASHAEDQLDRLRDQNATTDWSATLAEGEKLIWIEATFDAPIEISSFQVARGAHWNPHHTLALKVPDGSGGWKSVTPPNLRSRMVPIIPLERPVTTDRVRLEIDAARFHIAEFELFAPVRSSEPSLISRQP